MHFILYHYIAVFSIMFVLFTALTLKLIFALLGQLGFNLID